MPVRRLRLPLIAAVIAALCLTLPWAASGQREGSGPSPGEVPIATRFCGEGGDPAKPGNGADPRGVNPRSGNPLAGLDLFVNKILDPAY